MDPRVNVRNLALAVVFGGLAMQAALAFAAPTTRPGGGSGSSCEDAYKSCKKHCKTYGTATSAFQTCITNCKKEHDACKPPASKSPQ